MNEFREFYLEVEDRALELGYTKEQVRMFKGDIEEHFNNNLTVEQVVEAEF